jgi:hypothetical protein
MGQAGFDLRAIIVQNLEAKGLRGSTLTSKSADDWPEHVQNLGDDFSVYRKRSLFAARLHRPDCNLTTVVNANAHHVVANNGGYHGGTAQS